MTGWRRGSVLARMGLGLLLGLWTAGPALASRAPSPAAEPIEFWVIEPNEGDSAGGHAALRIGESVFHVQRRPDGLLSDWRTPRVHFERVYRGLGNRGIRAIPLALDPTERARLTRSLENRFFDRRQRLTRLDTVERELAWLENALEREALSIEVPGLGLIGDASGDCEDPRSRHLARFKRTLAERKGESWLASRLERAEGHVDHGIAELGSTSDDPALPELVEALRTREALAMLHACRRPAPERMIEVPGSAVVDAPSRAGLGKISRALEARLHALLESPRDDVGLAILLTAARWTAIEESLHTGRLIAIDPLADPPGKGDAIEGGLPEAWLSRLDDEARERLARHVANLEEGAAPLEARLVSVEAALHDVRRLRERTRPADDGRWVNGTTPPDRRYAAAVLPLPRPETIAPEGLARRRDLFRAVARETRGNLETDLQYALFYRNCVTELTRLLRKDARDPGSGWGFIPVAAGRRVERLLGDAPSRTLPSARFERLADLEHDGSRRANGWREWSPLTSHTYRPRPVDSSFLFFTRERRWSRPLLGAANLVFGTGTALVGFLSAPLDQGERLRGGAQGVVMSVPELFFFSVRQGTYPVVPPGLDESGRGPEAPTSD